MWFCFQEEHELDNCDSITLARSFLRCLERGGRAWCLVLLHSSGKSDPNLWWNLYLFHEHTCWPERDYVFNGSKLACSLRCRLAPKPFLRISEHKTPCIEEWCLLKESLMTLVKTSDPLPLVVRSWPLLMQLLQFVRNVVFPVLHLATGFPARLCHKRGQLRWE